MTDLTVYQPHNALSADMEYARVISSGAMLPTAYRGKPADILIAMGLGQSMGLSPAESLYRIHVIQGRPTASAELIAANVRKAGHILRVKGDETSARAVIIRSDDPDFEYESVWNLDRAKRLGLSDKDGWKKQPGVMMKWRAITEVARMACSEALYGVAYVREELDDDPRPAAPRVSAADFLPATEPVEVTVFNETTGEVTDGITTQQSRALHASFGKANITDREQRLAYCRNLIGRHIESSADLTKAEASRILDALKADADGTQDDPWVCDGQTDLLEEIGA